MLKFEELFEVLHKEYNNITLILTSDSNIFGDKVFRKNLKNILYRFSLSYTLEENYMNKRKYSIKIDSNRYKIIADFCNDVVRDINVTLENMKLKPAETSVKHTSMWIKLP